VSAVEDTIDGRYWGDIAMVKVIAGGGGGGRRICGEYPSKW